MAVKWWIIEIWNDHLAFSHRANQLMKHRQLSGACVHGRVREWMWRHTKHTTQCIASAQSSTNKKKAFSLCSWWNVVHAKAAASDISWSMGCLDRWDWAKTSFGIRYSHSHNTVSYNQTENRRRKHTYKHINRPLTFSRSKWSSVECGVCG